MLLPAVSTRTPHPHVMDDVIQVFPDGCVHILLWAQWAQINLIQPFSPPPLGPPLLLYYFVFGSSPLLFLPPSWLPRDWVRPPTCVSSSPTCVSFLLLLFQTVLGHRAVLVFSGLPRLAWSCSVSPNRSVYLDLGPKLVCCGVQGQQRFLLD